MHRLITEVGWPVLMLAAFLAGAATPTLLGWLHDEFHHTQKTREGWPYW